MTDKPLKPVIAEDGVTHINVYSRGKTAVGRALSNFTYAPFHHPEFGQFASVEGFWYWLSSGANAEHDRLRELYGFSAKLYGTGLHTIPQDDEYFQEQICRAIECKVRQNPDIAKEVMESTLPFLHYMVMSEKDYREPGQFRMWPVMKAKHRWQMDFLEGLRRALRIENGLDPQSEVDLSFSVVDLSQVLLDNSPKSLERRQAAADAIVSVIWDMAYKNWQAARG